MRRVAVLLALVVGGLAAAPASGAAPARLDYVALGDSVASGHGLSDRGGACRRSPHAYPRLVLAEVRDRAGAVRFATFACSGASVTLPEQGLQSLDRQVDRALDFLRLRRPALVTITAGVNDLGWADVLATYARLREPDGAIYAAWVETTVAGVEAELRRQLDRLLRRRGVRVVLTDYPNPVNPQSILFGGPLACPDTAVCYARTELLVDTLNEAIARLAGRRVVVAGSHDAFRGHEGPRPKCGGGTPDVADTWFQHPDDPESNSFPPVEQFVGEQWRGDCFHPNLRGAQAIAAAVDAAARSLGR